MNTYAQEVPNFVSIKPDVYMVYESLWVASIMLNFRM